MNIIITTVGKKLLFIPPFFFLSFDWSLLNLVSNFVNWFSSYFHFQLLVSFSSAYSFIIFGIYGSVGCHIFVVWFLSFFRLQIFFSNSFANCFQNIIYHIINTRSHFLKVCQLYCAYVLTRLCQYLFCGSFWLFWSLQLAFVFLVKLYQMGDSALVCIY